MTAQVVSRYYPDAAKRFTSDTAKHEMTVLHDEGLYRHIRFKAPGTFSYFFDLITWPGCLTVRGDMGAFTFARVPDMLEFFLSGPDINPQYWAEKALGAKGEIESYSPDRLRQSVTQAYVDHAEANPGAEYLFALWAAIEREIWPNAYDERDALRAVNEFEFMDPGHRNKTAFVFTDVSDWDLFGYTHRYLWCCFAIRWGAQQYRVAQQS